MDLIRKKLNKIDFKEHKEKKKQNVLPAIHRRKFGSAKIYKKDLKSKN